MSEITHPRGLTYRGDEHTVSIYDFWLRGRPVLEVTVDTADPELTISVGKPGTMNSTDPDDLFIKTNGRARWSSLGSHFEGPEDDDDDDDADIDIDIPVADESGPRMLDSNSIRSYVQPRLAVLIARVFVPGDIYV